MTYVPTKSDFPLSFDEEKHLYTYDGRTLPSVTQILADSNVMPPYPGDRFYLDRGRAVAKMVELDCNGRLDPQKTHPEIRKFLRGWREARANYNWFILGSEVRLAHIPLWFGGTTDLLLTTNDGNIAVVDCKCSDSANEPAKATDLQTAAYVIAAEWMWRRGVLPINLKLSKIPPPHEWQRFGLMLMPDTKQKVPYKLVPYHQSVMGLEAWKGATFLYHWRNGKR